MKRLAPFVLVLVSFVVGVWFSFRDAEGPADAPAGLAAPGAPASGREGARGDVSRREGPSAAPSDGSADPAPGGVPTDPAPAESSPPDYDGFVDEAMARLPATLPNREAIAERLKKLLRESPDDPEVLAGVVAWLRRQNRDPQASLMTCEQALALQPGNHTVRWQHWSVLLLIAGSAGGYTEEDTARQFAAVRGGVAAEPDNAMWGIFEASLRLRRGDDPGAVLAGLREAVSRPTTSDGLIEEARGYQRITRDLLETPAVVHPSELLRCEPPFVGVFQMQGMGRSLISLAEPHLIAGRWEEATEVLSLVQEVGTRIRASGASIHFLVGHAIDRTATREMVRLAETRGDHARLRQAQDRLARGDPLKSTFAERLSPSAEQGPLAVWTHRANEVLAKYGRVLDLSNPWSFFDGVSERALLDRMTPDEREVILDGADLIFEEHRIIQEILAGAPSPQAGG